MILESQITAVPDDGENERVDRHEALSILHKAFPPDRPPEGYVVGRTKMRNAIAEASGCSLLRAETLIKRLLEQGLVEYEGSPRTIETTPGLWRVGART